MHLFFPLRWRSKATKAAPDTHSTAAEPSTWLYDVETHVVHHGAQDALYSVAYNDASLSRAQSNWGADNIKSRQDILTIGPIGSRGDTLLFWRAGKRIVTGCFEGTLSEFVDQLDCDYGRRLDQPDWPGSNIEETRRHLREYRALIAFLRALAR